MLQEVDLGENELSNCAGVAEMPLLTTLSLDTNKLTSIEGLAGLPAVPAREGGRQPGTPGAEVVLGGSRPFSRSSRPFTRCA